MHVCPTAEYSGKVSEALVYSEELESTHYSSAYPCVSYCGIGREGK